LWLWVLDGTDGRQNTVITCFPHREKWMESTHPSDEALFDPDPEGFTDVSRHINLYLLTEPVSVRTAYDLAEVIASECSKVYLNIESIKETLRFLEVYATAIGDVVRI
jgi:hypothetical protein